MLYFWSRVPPYTFSAFCTYDITYRLTASIWVAGETLTDSVVFQNAHSRKWISVMNQAGCPSERGTALSFRTRSGAVILISGNICNKDSFVERSNPLQGVYPNDADFAEAMKKGTSINVKDLCYGIEESKYPEPNWLAAERKARKRPQAYVIDNWERPKLWEGATFGYESAILGTGVNLLSATATAVDTHPEDNLEKNASGLLRAGFEYKDSWWHSPERLISFGRRYRDGFEFQVKQIR
jgi:hypothetical protein